MHFIPPWSSAIIGYASCLAERARYNHHSSTPQYSTRTVALVTVISTSPRAALISSPNLVQTPPRRPRRLFSARVWRKFLTVALVPEVFSSSAMMADLSAGVRVGAWRMAASFASWLTRPPSLFRAVAVGSSEEDLTAAVYCLFGQNDALAFRCSLLGWPVAPAHQLHVPHLPMSQLIVHLLPPRVRLGAVTYQGSGIGAIDAEEGDGRLDGLGGGGGGVEANLRGNRPRGSCSTS